MKAANTAPDKYFEKSLEVMQPLIYICSLNRNKP